MLISDSEYSDVVFKLDQLIGNGPECVPIIQIIGPFTVGKTELVLGYFKNRGLIYTYLDLAIYQHCNNNNILLNYEWNSFKKGLMSKLESKLTNTSELLDFDIPSKPNGCGLVEFTKLLFADLNSLSSEDSKAGSKSEPQPTSGLEVDLKELEEVASNDGRKLRKHKKGEDVKRVKVKLKTKEEKAKVKVGKKESAKALKSEKSALKTRLKTKEEKIKVKDTLENDKMSLKRLKIEKERGKNEIKKVIKTLNKVIKKNMANMKVKEKKEKDGVKLKKGVKGEVDSQEDKMERYMRTQLRASKREYEAVKKAMEERAEEMLEEEVTATKKEKDEVEKQVNTVQEPRKIVYVFDNYNELMNANPKMLVNILKMHEFVFCGMDGKRSEKMEYKLIIVIIGLYELPINFRNMAPTHKITLISSLNQQKVEDYILNSFEDRVFNTQSHKEKNRSKLEDELKSNLEKVLDGVSQREEEETALDDEFVEAWENQQRYLEPAWDKLNEDEAGDEEGKRTAMAKKKVMERRMEMKELIKYVVNVLFRHYSNDFKSLALYANVILNHYFSSNIAQQGLEANNDKQITATSPEEKNEKKKQIESYLYNVLVNSKTRYVNQMKVSNVCIRQPLINTVRKIRGVFGGDDQTEDSKTVSGSTAPLEQNEQNYLAKVILIGCYISSVYKIRVLNQYNKRFKLGHSTCHSEGSNTRGGSRVEAGSDDDMAGGSEKKAGAKKVKRTNNRWRMKPTLPKQPAAYEEDASNEFNLCYLLCIVEILLILLDYRNWDRHSIYRNLLNLIDWGYVRIISSNNLAVGRTGIIFCSFYSQAGASQRSRSKAEKTTLLRQILSNTNVKLHLNVSHEFIHGLLGEFNVNFRLIFNI